VERAGALIENLLAEVGARLLSDGFTRFLVAGARRPARSWAH